MMKKTLLISLLSGLFLTSCLPLPTPPNENVSLLYERFHGKYKAIQSTSSVAIDVNLDSRATTDMLIEIPDLASPYRNYLELRIYSPSKYSSSNTFLFTQWWPEQYIKFYESNEDWMGELADYNPTGIVNYAMQGVVRYFSFSPDLKQIVVNPSTVEDPFRWVRPESVTINADDTIQIVNKRRLYTSAGVKDVVITTVYKRYTIVT